MFYGCLFPRVFIFTVSENHVDAVMMLSCCFLGFPSMAVSMSVLHLRATALSAFSTCGDILPPLSFSWLYLLPTVIPYLFSKLNTLNGPAILACYRLACFRPCDTIEIFGKVWVANFKHYATLLCLFACSIIS